MINLEHGETALSPLAWLPRPVANWQTHHFFGHNHNPVLSLRIYLCLPMVANMLAIGQNLSAVRSAPLAGTFQLHVGSHNRVQRANTARIGKRFCLFQNGRSHPAAEIRKKVSRPMRGIPYRTLVRIFRPQASSSEQTALRRDLQCGRKHRRFPRSPFAGLIKWQAGQDSAGVPRTAIAGVGYGSSGWRPRAPGNIIFSA